ncbi:MAG: hypothetical protein IJC02_01430 [Lachnospiraceae bacterium]|nr:hypothetical protein [Lachnospiraceae bacterium]
MKKKLICSILALSLALIPMGYLAPAQTVQAAGALDLVTTEDGVQIYTSSWWYQATEDTLIFKELNNPASYSMITKGSYVHEIGFVAGNGVFHYVNLYDGSEIVMTGYIDGQYFEQQSNAPISIFKPIEVYLADEGYTAILTLKNPQIGVYEDQHGIPRNALGQEVDPFTGELWVEPEVYTPDLSKPLPSGSGVRVY